MLEAYKTTTMGLLHIALCSHPALPSILPWKQAETDVVEILPRMPRRTCVKTSVIDSYSPHRITGFKVWETMITC